MIKAYILRGMPLAGKSTWVGEHIKLNKVERFFIIDENSKLDDFNLTIFDPSKDVNLYYIDCNLEDSEVEAKIKRLNRINITDIEVVPLFDVSIEEILMRNSMLESPMATGALKSLYRNSRPVMLRDKIAKLSYLKDVDTSKPSAIIVDLDGTVAINTSNRPFFGEGSEEGYLNDTPVPDLIKMITLFQDNMRVKVIILTGRNDTELGRKNTIKWLANSGIVFDELHMRAVNDYSPAQVYKEAKLKEIMQNHTIRMVFEDDIRCIKMFRDYGLLTIAPSDGHL